MKLHPPLHLGEEAIEKVTFGSPLTKVANFTYNRINFSVSNNFYWRSSDSKSLNNLCVPRQWNLEYFDYDFFWE